MAFMAGDREMPASYVEMVTAWARFHRRELTTAQVDEWLRRLFAKGDRVKQVVEGPDVRTLVGRKP